MNVDLSCTIGSLELKNPVLTASGTCGYGEELADSLDVSSLGAVIPKSITVLPRLGNRTPRLAETASGLVNSIGLQNEGLSAFTAEKLPDIAKLGCPVIANIAGFSIEDFVKMAATLDEREEISGFELNISCPNVKEGGVHFGVNPSAAAEVTAAVRAVTGKTVIVKLTPNVTDITRIALAVEEAGADAVSLINTLSAMPVDAHSRKPVLGNVFGGLSGPAVKPVALRMVYLVHKALDIPVVGLGGIRTGLDAIEFILCGASAVEVGTGGLVTPQAPAEVLAGIRDYCEEQGVERLRDLIGALELP